jgi:hypothetical protein
MTTNQKAALIIFILLNLLALAVDPILAGIFLLMWPKWFHNHLKELEV